MDSLFLEVENLGKLILSEAEIEGEFADEFLDNFDEDLFNVA